MRKSSIIVLVTGISYLLVAHLSAQTAPASPVNNTPNDTARCLAGLIPSADSSLTALTTMPAWQKHAQFFDTAWADLEKKQLSKVREWSKTNMPEASATKGTVFYMFSGPDFLYVNTFYPDATTYVMCGIEPIGPQPDLSKLSTETIAGELRTLQSSLNSVLSFSFFRTIAMKDDLKNHALSGTMPILYIFLARSGMAIQDVSYVSLDAEGAMTKSADGALNTSSKANGVRIDFRKEGSDKPQCLYYFSTDISDGGVKNSGFLKFCKTLAPGNSCVKSASYLMHESYFSNVRNFLLENSNTLVQDDSGIPCKHFSSANWQLRCFGSYPGPIPLFKNYVQPDLTELYHATKPAPLDFGIGYRHYARESTLMIATRKTAPSGKESAEVAPPRAQPVTDGNSTQSRSQ